MPKTTSTLTIINKNIYNIILYYIIVTSISSRATTVFSPFTDDDGDFNMAGPDNSNYKVNRIINR
jgi:hypothetical protein